MERTVHTMTLLASAWLAASAPALAGQAPGAASDPDIPISHRDRVYSAEQFEPPYAPVPRSRCTVCVPILLRPRDPAAADSLRPDGSLLCLVSSKPMTVP
jgi:hypothetical protein